MGYRKSTSSLGADKGFVFGNTDAFARVLEFKDEFGGFFREGP